jgi:PAS domain S-box-containing protein
MHRTRKTELLIRASFVAAIALLVVIGATVYLRLVRGSAIAEELIVGTSVLALALVLLSSLALHRDFSGRTRAEAELNRFFDLALDIFVIAGGDGRYKRASAAVTDVLGYSVEEFLAIGYMDMIHPDDHLKTLQAVERQMKRGEAITHFEARFRHKDGSWRLLSWRSKPQGELMYAVARDVTDSEAAATALRESRDLLEVRVEQRTAELGAANETLRNSERRLSEQLQRLALLSRITHAIGERQDLRSIFQVVVRALEDELPVDFCLVSLYDAAQNQLSGSCVSVKTEPLATQVGLVEATIIPIDENGLGRCVQGHLVYEPDISATRFEFPRKLASAGMRSLVIAPLLVESQVFGVLVCARRDDHAFVSGECEFLRQVSEHTALASHQAQLYGALQRAYDDLRQTQQQVMQQERLRALGQMASGIAHDINNAISPMSLYADALLEREPNLTDTGRKQLETIQRAVDDVAATVARMGEFYRLREPRAALLPVDLNLLAEHVVDLTRARWSDMAQQRGIVIRMQLELDPGLPQIAAVESQIRDALVNLVFNAVDAMPNGGPLVIRTRGDGYGHHRISIEITDAGIGMDEDTRRRCLEPFFTTKGERGTGLGLAMVFGVAERHGATLDIESQPGQGTTVRLSFAALAQMVSPQASGAPVETGPQRILIIDDDPLLLRSLREALESDGHLVTTANGGQAGINTFVESHAEGLPFPVVITDLGMPNVDGRKVASTIKAAVPATLVLMLTGWGRRLVAEGDIPPGVDEVLSKPPKLIDLRNALATRLGMRKSS